MTIALVAGAAVWLGIDFGLELWRGRYFGAGMLAGAAVALVGMLAVYAVCRRQWRATLTRRARYRLRGHT